MSNSNSLNTRAAKALGWKHPELSIDDGTEDIYRFLTQKEYWPKFGSVLFTSELCFDTSFDWASFGWVRVSGLQGQPLDATICVFPLCILLFAFQETRPQYSQ